MPYWTSSKTTLLGWYILKSRTSAAIAVSIPRSWKSDAGNINMSLSVTPSDEKSVGFPGVDLTGGLEFLAELPAVLPLAELIAALF